MNTNKFARKLKSFMDIATSIEAKEHVELVDTSLDNYLKLIKAQSGYMKIASTKIYFTNEFGFSLFNNDPRTEVFLLIDYSFGEVFTNINGATEVTKFTPNEIVKKYGLDKVMESLCTAIDNNEKNINSIYSGNKHALDKYAPIE